FDIEHDLAVGRVRRRRMIPRVIHRHGGDGRQRHIDLAEEDPKIAGAKAAPELDDRDGLSGPVEIDSTGLRWKIVALGELRRGDAVLTAGTGRRQLPGAR